MTTIYYVEHGEYDDYERGPSFTTEEAAKKYCGRMNELLPVEAGNTWSWRSETVLDECPEIFEHLHLVYHFRHVLAGVKESDMSYAREAATPTTLVYDEGKYLMVHGTDVDDVRETYLRQKILRGL